MQNTDTSGRKRPAPSGFVISASQCKSWICHIILYLSKALNLSRLISCSGNWCEHKEGVLMFKNPCCSTPNPPPPPRFLSPHSKYTQLIITNSKTYRLHTCSLKRCDVLHKHEIKVKKVPRNIIRHAATIKEYFSMFLLKATSEILESVAWSQNKSFWANKATVSSALQTPT